MPEFKGLFDKPARAGSARLAFRGPAAGHDYDLCIRVVFHKLAGAGEAVHAGHADVHEHDFRLGAIALFQSFDAVHGLAYDFVAEKLQRESQRASNRFRVFCNQYSHDLLLFSTGHATDAVGWLAAEN